jgi:hypothetical protein
MGTTVIGGMLAATGIAIFIIPALFVLVERLSARWSSEAPVHATVPQLSPSEGDQGDKTNCPVAGPLADYAPERGLRCGAEL